MRSRLTASGRVAVAVTLTLAVAVAGLSALAYVSTERRLRAELDRGLLREAAAYAAAVAGRPAGDDRSLVDASRAYLQARTGAGAALQPILLVRFADGRVLSNSAVRLERAEGNTALLAPATARRGFDSVALDGEPYRVTTAPVEDPSGRVVAVFQAGLPRAELDAVADELGRSLLIAGLAIVVAGALLSAWVARASLRPLRHIARTAERVEHSSLDERIRYDGPDDELGALADAIDSMLDRLGDAFERQRRFVADASHELRTPLAVLRGNLDLARHPGMSSEQRGQALETMQDELERMGRVVDDLLALARLDAPDSRPFQPLEIGTIVAETISRARTLGERAVTVDVANGTWVSGDPDLLAGALLNVVRNAFDHTEPGGSVTVSTRLSAEGKRATGRPGGTVDVIVADDGPGIPAEDLTRVFDRFYRAPGPRSRESGGSGLGLAIARRVVVLHGGDVRAANGPERGAVFTITLPTIPPPADY